MKLDILKLATSLVLATLSTLSVTHCGGDDDDDDAATGGSSGSGGDAGQAGEAGASSGTSGNSGRGGTGSGQGGDAGGGQAGAGSPGTGGTGAISGAGGEGGEPTGGGMGGAGNGGQPEEGAKTCALGCDSPDDCASESADIRRCDLELGRCVECVVHDDCIPVASAWVTSCTSDDDCFTLLGEVCVAVGGSGRCAPAYDSVLGCLFPGEEPITLPKFGAPSEMVDVCGKKSGRCEDHRCFTGCTDDANYCTTGLNTGYGDSCDAASGRCTCENDSECTHGPERCNPTTNRCDECGDAGDCAGASEGKDVCVDGRCGCSSESVCGAAAFPDATPLCE